MNFVGQYGVILSLTYFLLYAPLVSIFPSYYFSRIWSIVLILSLNLFIFLDSYLFIRYRFHLNSFLLPLMKENEALEAFGLNSFKLGLIGFLAAISFVIFWIRGEKLWRSMQARFSNPVSNWYLVVIFLCFGIAQGMHVMGEKNGSRNISRLSDIFPVQYALKANNFFEGPNSPLSEDHVSQGYKDFSYPSEVMVCPIKNPKNIVFIILDKWNESDFTVESMPHLFHAATHGQNFKNHFSGGLNKVDGYFSFLYSVAPTYSRSVVDQLTGPAFTTQLHKSNIKTSFFQFGAKSPLGHFTPHEKEISTDYVESQIPEKNKLGEAVPFVMSIYLESASASEKDKNAKSVFDTLIKHKLINETIIVVTGAYSEENRTPLFMIWPGKGRGEVTKMTSHYDILPTIMQEDWRCKNKVSDFSLGKNLFGTEETELQVMGNYNMLKIIDTKKQTITTLDDLKGFEVRDLVSNEIQGDKKDTHAILAMLERLTVFYRR